VIRMPLHMQHRLWHRGIRRHGIALKEHVACRDAVDKSRCRCKKASQQKSLKRIDAPNEALTPLFSCSNLLMERLCRGSVDC
jgi:hypothetical protein